MAGGAGPRRDVPTASDRLTPRAALSLWPVVADIRVRIRLDPAIEHVRECCRLGAAAGQVLLQHDDQDEVSFVGKVGDVLGDDGASFGTCVPRDRCVVGRTQPNLGHRMRVSAVLVAKNAGGRGREHPIDYQTDHRVLREQRLAFLGCPPAALPRGLAALDEPFDSLAMLSGIVDRTPNLSRMEIRLVGQCRDPLLLAAGQLPQPGDHFPHVGPNPQRCTAGGWRPAMDDARMVERIDTFKDQPLEQLRRANALTGGALGQALTCLIADPERRASSYHVAQL
jgi:hypothetical protein